MASGSGHSQYSRHNAIYFDMVSKGLQGAENTTISMELELNRYFFNMGRPAFDSKFKELVYKCCMYSTYTMPCFFILFNIIYWMVVLIGSGSAGSDVDFMILENTS